MPAATQLLAFGLRQVIDVAPDLMDNLAEIAEGVAESAGAAGKVFVLVRRRLTDHSETLPAALLRANDRAWQAVAVALAGRGFLTRVKEFFTGPTPRAIHDQVEGFLAHNADDFPGTSDEFRQACLRELREAQKAGVLSAERLDADATARQAAAYRGLADAAGLVAGARQAAAAVADALPPDYPSLARLLREATPRGQAPLLVSAFSFFFRREGETNAELFRGLTIDGLRQLSANQEEGFAEVGAALDGLDAELRRQGRRSSEIIDHLGHVGAVVERIDAKVDALSEQIADLARRNHVQAGPPRPQYAVTINNEREQALARRLLEEVRKLPAERQRADDLSLLGDVLRAAGLFREAKESYAGAAEQTGDRAARAANHYKAYLAALEQRQWDEGLAALTEAATLDEAGYAPFPLGKYRPKCILGAGGFGTAFLCWDEDMQEDVVVKTLHTTDLERSLSDVFGEAKILRLLSHDHPGIIGVHTGGYANREKTRPFIVMDYFPGVTLQAHLEQMGPKAVLPLEDVLPIARQVAAAMKAAHERGVLHRDLKPDNVMVRQDGDGWQAKVIDFGLAIRTRIVQVSTSRPAHERTRLGESAVGTAKYAPPEQLGEMPSVKPGPYSDVYAFGKLCCYALFRDTEPKRRQWASIPEALAELLERCTEKELEHRQRDFGGVLTLLEGLDPGEQKRREEEDARRQAEEQRQGQARQADERRRQEEEKRRQAEAARLRQEAEEQDRLRREREEADRQRREAEAERLRGEGLAKLRQMHRDALERTQGTITKEDNVAAADLCRAYHLSAPLAADTFREVRAEWEANLPVALPVDQARRIRPGEVIANDLGMKFACISAGTFLMGSPTTEESRADDETQHRVTLTKGLFLGIHPVTRGQFARFVKDAGYTTQAEREGGAYGWTGKEWKLDPTKNWHNPGFEQTDDHPVVCVSWNDSVALCDWLTKQDGQGRRYRLPTEAEWEYACRAGTTTPFSFGETISTDQANYDGNYTYGKGKKGVFRQATTPVESFPANRWGLYDMHGNVWEWCADWFGPYPQGEVIDQKGPEKGEYRVLRGGSWYDIPYGCRAACRSRSAPATRNGRSGCRVVFCLD